MTFVIHNTVFYLTQALIYKLRRSFSILNEHFWYFDENLAGSQYKIASHLPFAFFTPPGVKMKQLAIFLLTYLVHKSNI